MRLSPRQIMNLRVLAKYPTVHLPDQQGDALYERGLASRKLDGWTTFYSITDAGRAELAKRPDASVDSAPRP